jgi:hypothetical protein
MALPILRRLYSSSEVTISYSVNWARVLTPAPLPDPSAPALAQPRVERTAGIGLSWGFQNERRFLYSISTEEGRNVGLSFGLGARFLGSDVDVWRLSWHWTEYVPMPWKPKALRSQVLALSYAGGVAGGPLGRRGAFYLGGYPPQNLLQSIYDFSRPGSASLRGYPYASISGDHFEVLNLEYRFPIVWIERGYQTFPFYLRRLHGKVFADYGGAFDKGFTFDQLKLGIGGELILEITYAWYYGAALQLGYAYGVQAGGGNQVYFLLNNPF